MAGGPGSCHSRRQCLPAPIPSLLPPRWNHPLPASMLAMCDSHAGNATRSHHNETYPEVKIETAGWNAAAARASRARAGFGLIDPFDVGCKGPPVQDHPYMLPALLPACTFVRTFQYMDHSASYTVYRHRPAAASLGPALSCSGGLAHPTRRLFSLPICWRN